MNQSRSSYGPADNYMPVMNNQQQQRTAAVDYSRDTNLEEPICVLKIELDGDYCEEIQVFRHDEPHELVQQFGHQFNLSESAKQRLFDQINEQLEAQMQ